MSNKYRTVEIDGKKYEVKKFEDTQKFEINMPFFHGFYGTSYSMEEVLSEEFLSDFMEEYLHLTNENAIKYFYENCLYWFDYDTYVDSMALSAYQEINNVLSKDKDIKDIKYLRLSSPREYNFSNDTIIVSITIDVNSILDRYIYKNRNNFAKMLKSKYSSYDGFISFIPKDIKTFLLELDPEVLLPDIIENIYSEELNSIEVCLNECLLSESMSALIHSFDYSLAFNKIIQDEEIWSSKEKIDPKNDIYSRNFEIFNVL